LPITVTLGPDDAMRPENALTPDSKIVVGARISKSGSATPQAGDLEGQSDPVIVGNAGDLKVIIKRELGQN
jgi:cytochrome c-type biogenesis protein CcmH